jgi:hypothetical protein
MCVYLGIIAACLWLGGIAYSITWIASLPNSLQRIASSGSTTPDGPNWSDVTSFWSPIKLNTMHPDDPIISFCRLDFKSYSQTPHLYPMFRDLVAVSKCGGSNSKTARLSVVKADPEFQGKGGHYLEPSGFVFHESRVGSTLVANALGKNLFPHYKYTHYNVYSYYLFTVASDPWNLQ